MSYSTGSNRLNKEISALVKQLRQAGAQLNIKTGSGTDLTVKNGGSETTVSFRPEGFSFYADRRVLRALAR